MRALVAAALRLAGAAGGVGSLFVQLARARGARVVASASARRETLLRELGAEMFLDRHAGQELDMVADPVGYGTLATSLPVVREGGRAGSIDRNITLHVVRCARWWTRSWTWPMRPRPTGGSSPGAAKARSS